MCDINELDSSVNKNYISCLVICMIDILKWTQVDPCMTLDPTMNTLFAQRFDVVNQLMETPTRLLIPALHYRALWSSVLLTKFGSHIAFLSKVTSG